jgi:hypothetical protein
MVGCTVSDEPVTPPTTREAAWEAYRERAKQNGYTTGPRSAFEFAWAAALAVPAGKAETPDARLIEIQERADAASPGPWHRGETWDKKPSPTVRANGGLNTSIATILTPGVSPSGNYREPEDRPLANAEFIAHAREDIPYLLSLLAPVAPIAVQGEDE